ncbi:hypothetical protein E2320_016626 [Naja naja]|nr:hypothetical protein E2320_016626 [Naja naja]
MGTIRGGERWKLMVRLSISPGDLDATMGLQCFQPFRSNFVNCSWLTWESQNANATYVLHYESLKLGKLLIDHGQVHSVVAQMGQNWLVIERRDLTHGDEYSIWMEVRSANEIAVSKKLNFSLDEIVKPCLPELDHVELDCSEATVTWKNPQWFEFHNDQPLTYAIRYKASTDHEWTYETNLDQENHELYDLKPFTCYEVQVRCIPGNSEWSSSKSFCTCEAAPFGQVDVWQKGCISDRQNESCLLLWKALDPDAAQGTILDYEVIVQDHSKAVHRMNYNCCQALIPIAAQYVSIAARNSVKKTPWANLSLEKTELPGPEDITVMPTEGLGLNVTWKPSMDSQWVQPQKYVVEWRKEMVDSAGELLNWTSTPGSRTSALLRVPSAGPQGLQDRRLSSTATSISWEEIPLADRNGHIIHYTLYLKHLHSGSLMVHAPINATERNYIISDLEPGTTYHAWMTGSTSAGEGAASAVHHFSTSVFHWQNIVIILVVVILFTMSSLVVLVKYRRLLGLCHKVLPRWCWEKIPDPKHSGIAAEMNEESTAPAMETLIKYSTQFPEIMDIAEISEEIPEPPPPPQAGSNTMVISGYEKRVLPTQEEILNWTEQERNTSPCSGLRERET